jgi:predicted ArsR family transcriptional regulator
MDDQSSNEPARSRDRILELMLRSDEPLGVQSLAAALGISRNAAHQHVAAMEREGLIERASAIRTKGRPSQGFRLSAAGKSTFPRQYSLLARQLLEELSRHLGPEQLGAAMTRMGATLANGLGAELPADPDERVRAIAGMMRDLGYESKAVEGDTGTEIEAHNCVFHDLAFADPAICEVDLSLLRSLSGQRVEHRRCMARGERSCRFAFRPAKAAD